MVWAPTPAGGGGRPSTASLTSSGSRRAERLVGVVIHIVALPGLAGAAMAAPVMGDGTGALGGHEEQLVVPGVGVEGPAVTEDDGLARALVLVEDRRSIRCGDGTCTHGIISSLMFEHVLLFRVFGTLVIGRSGEPIAPGITLCLRLSLLLSGPPVSALLPSQPESSPRAGTGPAARRSRHRPRMPCLLRPRRS